MIPAEKVPDIRAAIARDGRHLYEVAALLRPIKIHPTTLGQMLRGRRPMPEDVAKRVLEVVRG